MCDWNNVRFPSYIIYLTFLPNVTFVSLAVHPLPGDFSSDGMES